MLLGCIGDDFTGSTDLAGMLVKGGMRTVQTIGVTSSPLTAKDRDACDACVVALKSRTAPVEEAVAESLAALRWLREQGCERFYFKYCSTFDSTPAGNIGPVTDALLDALAPGDAGFTIACPAFPENGRTIFRGYLFVGDVLLSESGMARHPLTPMTDANLVRVLQPQTRRKVGLVPFDVVRRGRVAIRDRFTALRGEGVGIAIVDATADADLVEIGAACDDLPLVTAGSGIGLGLARHYRASGRLTSSSDARVLPRASGASAVVSGSCSVATNGQVREWLRTRPAYRIDPLAIAAGRDVVGEALRWATPRVASAPVLVYATSEPDVVREVQERLGAGRAGELVESTLARIAQGLVERGVRRLVVAGGETSGAVVRALGVSRLRIGAEIAPGVPWTEADLDDARANTGGKIALALKSGNFGGADFFERALAMLDAAPAVADETRTRA